jgi:hypothetical protein
MKGHLITREGVNKSTDFSEWIPLLYSKQVSRGQMSPSNIEHIGKKVNKELNRARI